MINTIDMPKEDVLKMLADEKTKSFKYEEQINKMYMENKKLKDELSHVRLMLKSIEDDKVNAKKIKKQIKRKYSELLKRLDGQIL